MQHQTLSFSLTLFCIFVSLLSVSAVNSVIYVQCSPINFISNKSYAVNLNTLFTSLVESASVSNFNKFKISPPGYLPSDVVYGLFQCRGDLSYPNCRECVASSVSPLKITCPVSIGGSIQLEGCLVKYNNTSPFGFEDKMEVFKSCGPSIGYDSDVMNHVDDALAYLIFGTGEYFRTSESSGVLGVAQCVEDLTPSECQNCIVEARARLRSECVSSTWGDMYLGKCYIQYADHGTGDGNDIYNDNHNKTDNNDNHGDTDINNILKVVAIIVAVMLSSGGVFYYFSLTITKSVVRNNSLLQVNKLQEVNELALEAKKEAKTAEKIAQQAKEIANKEDLT